MPATLLLRIWFQRRCRLREQDTLANPLFVEVSIKLGGPNSSDESVRIVVRVYFGFAQDIDLYRFAASVKSHYIKVVRHEVPFAISFTKFGCVHIRDSALEIPTRFNLHKKRLLPFFCSHQIASVLRGSPHCVTFLLQIGPDDFLSKLALACVCKISHRIIIIPAST